MSPAFTILGGDRALWRSPIFLRRSLEGLTLFLLSCVANFIAGRNATALASHWVTDAVLTNTPPIGSIWFHMMGPVFLDAAMVAALFLRPRYLPFAAKSMAILIFLRAVAINLTHLGVYPDAPPVTGSVFTFGGDLFFSNHTGLPLLLGFIFAKEFPRLGTVLFVTGALFGINSLLAHVHYSIDVFAAPFMAYGAYAMSKRAFRKDFALIEEAAT